MVENKEQTWAALNQPYRKGCGNCRHRTDQLCDTCVDLRPGWEDTVGQNWEWDGE